MFGSKLRTAQAQMVEDHQRQLEHVQKTSEANADRTRRRFESEIAGLKSIISKLEADLAKVNRPCPGVFPLMLIRFHSGRQKCSRSSNCTRRIYNQH